MFEYFLNLVIERYPLLPLPAVLEEYWLLSYVHYHLSSYLAVPAIALGLLLMIMPRKRRMVGKVMVGSRLVGLLTVTIGLLVWTLGLVTAIPVTAMLVFLLSFRILENTPKEENNGSY